MKKITKIISLLLVMLFAFGFLAACGSNDEIVGTWVWEDDVAFTYTFNSDGTGVRGGSIVFPASDFEWRISGSELRIECPVAMLGVDSERWNFTIEDDVLILDSLQGGGQGLRYNRR